MTNDLRSLQDAQRQNVSQFAFVSHFDIYTEPHQMSVMPGWKADDHVLGDAEPGGLKDYKIRAFANRNVGQLVAVGNKADGTGSKVWFKTDSAGASRPDGDFWAERLSPSSDEVEGDANLLPPRRTNMYFSSSANVIYPVIVGTDTRIASADLGGGVGAVNENVATLSSTAFDSDGPRIVFERGSNSTVYFTKTGVSNLASITGAATVNLNTKSTSDGVTDIHSFGSLFLIAVRDFQNLSTNLIMWDFGLDQQVVVVPNSDGAVVGTVGDIPIVVTEQFLQTSLTNTGRVSNNLKSFVVRAVLGNSTETIYRFETDSTETGRLLPLRAEYKGGFLFYARVPADADGTTYREGIWCVGRKNQNSSIAVSLLLDTSSVGEMNGFLQAGNRMFLAAGEDWGVYQLDDYINGDYDIDATAETLLYGSETPYEKQLEGVTIMTDPLGAGESVSLHYRTSVNDAWTLMGTSDSGERHNFTTADGSPIGKFQEIQFKLTASGKITVRSMVTLLNELDDIVYGL